MFTTWQTIQSQIKDIRAGRPVDEELIPPEIKVEKAPLAQPSVVAQPNSHSTQPAVPVATLTQPVAQSTAPSAAVAKPSLSSGAGFQPIGQPVPSPAPKRSEPVAATPDTSPQGGLRLRSSKTLILLFSSYVFATTDRLSVNVNSIFVLFNKVKLSLSCNEK